MQIGVVESVQGISWTEYTVTGVSNHAGTTPMRLRRDAGYLAASVNVFARKLAWEMGGHQVATVGALSLRPNLINVVPNRAVFTRRPAQHRRGEAEGGRGARRRPHRRRREAERVEVEASVLARFEPVIFDAGLVDRVEHHAQALALSTRRMPSGAGHDAQMMQRLCPTAMIFVPSVAGLSHNVKEHTEASDLVAGAQVLLNLMLELAEKSTTAGRARNAGACSPVDTPAERRAYLRRIERRRKQEWPTPRTPHGASCSPARRAASAP